MSTLVVMYPKPDDPAHFDRHFRDVHMPLVEKMPGLRGYSFGPAKTLEGGDAAFFWVFNGRFDSASAVGDALSSPEGQAAVADIPNYSKAGPTILVLETTDG